jgi:hypothetical protein
MSDQKHLVSAAAFAAEMAPIANSPADAAITGRAGLVCLHAG